MTLGLSVLSFPNYEKKAIRPSYGEIIGINKSVFVKHLGQCSLSTQQHAVDAGQLL